MKDCDIVTQSLLSTSTVLLGFLRVGEGQVSHLRTEGDRGVTSAPRCLPGVRPLGEERLRFAPRRAAFLPSRPTTLQA